ncbi:signal recognition particle-docking protein FtsY [Methylobacterium currus]|uniref:Signal recognition particle receptor FtsY n=1 Tax=Methylobacterium currus TaxID=2051553 RepID=A0A2R4WID1_9HYPH|nr:signal recognition particle-docking protein FtsY [Methylobacterium currus]AWB21304.1 signal recognition particle-docking protein FtsY [Methylobacterium currus]UHC13943.1 signal recognition particle-docking protein FtsY [Methylobacterium currus]
MSETKQPGWFGRLFGRKAETPTETPAETPAEAPAGSAEPGPDPAGTMPTEPTGTLSEGVPDFATGADDVLPAPPTVTEASPETEPAHDLPEELAGADLEPVEGMQPEGQVPAAPEPEAAEAPEAEIRDSAVEASEVQEPEVQEPEVQEPEVQESEPASLVIYQPPAEPEAPAEKRSWWGRLTGGLKRTSSALSDRVTGLFTKRKLDADTLEELEDALIQADFGLETATRIAEAVGKGRYEKGIAPDEVRAILATEVERALDPVAQPLVIDTTKKPFVILMIGVNGAGKTTTIGKLTQKFRAQGHSVMLAAGDTFRAAAIEQLRVWGERTGAPVVARPQGSDAAGLAYDALQAARDAGTDILLIDTAGRLQNKAGLMAELEKVIRVIRKLDAETPHAVLLVLDATVGQNALNQVEIFQRAAGVTGLVMTKLDGTARGGILVALAAKFGLPVHYIGVGEGVDDLEPFAARDFARAIAGLDKG